MGQRLMGWLGFVLLAGCVEEPPEPFSDATFEPNNSLSTAYDLGTGTGTYTASAWIHPDHDDDWFSLEIEEDAYLTATLDGDDFALVPYKSSGTWFYFSRSGPTVLAPGRYYFQVTEWTGGGTGTFFGQSYTISGSGGPTGSYTLTLKVEPGPKAGQNDMGTGADAGDTFDTATTLSGSGTGELYFGLDSVDYYQVYSAGNQWIDVKITAPEGVGFALEFYRPDGSRQYTTYGGWVGTAGSFSVPGVQKGIYRVRLSITSGQGNYALELVAP